MPSFMDLSVEMKEAVILKVESVEDVISIGSTCTSLARIVGQEKIWKLLLAKTELVGEDRVRRIAAFFTSLKDNEAHFQLLQETIYTRHPGTAIPKGGVPFEAITVSAPLSPHQLHLVSILGLQLLAQAASREAIGWSWGARQVLHRVKVWRMEGPLLLSLTSLHLEKLTTLDASVVVCTTEEEGVALFSLLERCSSWRVNLDLSGEVAGQTWARLAREVARGRLMMVRTTREVLRRAAREDLVAFWRSRVQQLVVVGEQNICKYAGAEEGWEKIENMMQ